MSLSKNPKLIQVSKTLCRELRKKATPAEKEFWDIVRNKKLMNKKFYRQYPIFFDYIGKETFFIADFYCFEEKLVIEIDGGYHERQKEYDNKRSHLINQLGIEVLRFKNEEVFSDMETILSKIKTYNEK